MKSYIAFIILSIMLISCDSKTEIWGLTIGDTQENVEKILVDKNVETQSNENCIYINSGVSFLGIQWDLITCIFQENKLNSIEFWTYSGIDNKEEVKILNYLDEKGFGTPYRITVGYNKAIFVDKKDITASIRPYPQGKISTFSLSRDYFGDFKIEKKYISK